MTMYTTLFWVSSSPDPTNPVLVGVWGDALAGFCRENSAIARVTWHEWATTLPAPRVNPDRRTTATAALDNGTGARSDPAAVDEPAMPSV